MKENRREGSTQETKEIPALRHGMAVMAIGWYLLLPPMSKEPNCSMRWAAIHPNLPISQWELAQSFDTSERCNNECLLRWGRYREATLALGKEALAARQVGSLTKLKEDELHNLITAEQQAFAARCIATDDPRLKPLK